MTRPAPEPQRPISSAWRASLQDAAIPRGSATDRPIPTPTSTQPNPVFLGYLFAAVVFWIVGWREGRAGAADFRAAVMSPPAQEEGAAG